MSKAEGNSFIKFVIIANPWGQGIDNPTSKHHICVELLRAGHKVLWINGTGMRRPDMTRLYDIKRAVNKIGECMSGWRGVSHAKAQRRKMGRESDGIGRMIRGEEGQRGGVGGSTPAVVAPFTVPLPHSRLARQFNANSYMAAAERMFGNLADVTLLNFLPVLSELQKDWPGRSVYYCVDRWDAFAMYDSELMAELNRKCCRGADDVVASSKDLFDRCKLRNENVHLIRHGVSFDHFVTAVNDELRRPSDLPDGKIIGFFGLISEWVDQELLVRLAKEIPDAHIVLIGKADVNVESLATVSNIHILGPKLFDELPSYVAHFDVGIIPFVVNDLTKAVNPIKLREMLAAGCPVVSTDLEEVRGWGAPETDDGRRTAEGKGEERRWLRAETGDGMGGDFNASRDHVGTVRDSQWKDAKGGGRGQEKERNLQGVVLAKGAEEFVDGVRSVLENALSKERKRVISEAMRDEDWTARVGQIVDIVHRLPDVKIPRIEHRLRYVPYPPTSLPIRDLFVLENIPFDKETSVMEIGVGSGETCARLAMDCEKVVGMDASDAGIHKIEYLKQRHENLDLICADATSDADIGVQFDVVVSCDTLEHVADPKKFFEFVVRHLKPGGTAHILFPNELPGCRHGITGFGEIGRLKAEAGNPSAAGKPERGGEVEVFRVEVSCWVRFVILVSYGWLRWVRRLFGRRSGACKPQCFDETNFFRHAELWTKLAPLINLYWLVMLRMCKVGGNVSRVRPVRVCDFDENCSLYVRVRKKRDRGEG